MMRFHKLVATVGGIGFVGKGGGTIAAIGFCIIWLLIPAGLHTVFRQVFFISLILFLGVWSSNNVDSIWGKDSNKVVIDEVAGMMITLLFLPVTLYTTIVGLVLFRFFDIAKPLYIRNLEKWPKGWGVMADDVLAGLYAHLVLWLILQLNLFT